MIPSPPYCPEVKIMNKHLYEKLALTNIRKNGKVYLPYLLTIIGSMMFYYILTSLGSNPNIYNITTHAEAFKGASTLCAILQSGSFAASVFAFIFLLYANSFVLKHQKRQLGLYRVLGMDRKHIVRIITAEVFFLFSIGIILALFLGVLFDKLMLVLLFKIINHTAPIGLLLNTNAIIQTLIIAGCITGLILLRSLVSILTAKDIELLKSDKAGEKEPKNRPLQTLIGLIILGFGYGIALKATGVGTAINNFLPAALLVMIGTYLLFMAGSVTILKQLKKKKNYYYTTKHFISVSGLLYRMKQNANGLATICILSTAAIIVLSAGAALYANGERSIDEQFPRILQLGADTANANTVEELLEATMSEQNFHAENKVTCSFGSSLYTKTETGIEPMNQASFIGFENTPDTFIMTLKEYNRFNQSTETLQENEILLYASDNFLTGENLTFLGQTYQIKDVADSSCLDYITDYSMSLFSKLLIVTPTEEVYRHFVGTNDLSSEITYWGFDSTQSIEEIIAFKNHLAEAFATNGIKVDLSVKQQEADSFYSMYGGILFVGISLGLLFILSTVMIIYYKQISEGYEDRERFLIMQKVGLSKAEIKKSIHSQIMLVFFLPLVTAIIHCIVALKIVAACLQMVVIVHMPTFIASAIVVCILFSLIYALVYKITSKEYYNIVNE